MATMLEERPTHVASPRRSSSGSSGRRQAAPEGVAPRPTPRGVGFGGVRTVGIVAALVAIAVAVVLLAKAIGGFDVSLFGTTKVDRSAPVVLKQLRDVVDLHGRDR